MPAGQGIFGSSNSSTEMGPAFEHQDEPIKNWAIYIDIEGFATNYLTERGQVISGLSTLMETIYEIGTHFCSERSKRLCAFQTGDGFFINSEYGSPNVPIAIAVILMRKALMAGCLTRIGISEGETVGISGWWPEKIRRNVKDVKVKIGSGLMYLFPVMGTAYINANKVIKSEAKGSLLLITSDLAQKAAINSWESAVSNRCNVIDWVHSEHSGIDNILKAAHLFSDTPRELEQQLIQSANNAVSCHFSGFEAWITNTLRYNNCEQ